MRKIRAYVTRRGLTLEKLRPLLAPFEPIRNTKGIDPKGVLMVNCRGDTANRAETVKRYWEAIRKPEIIWYDGDHYGLTRHAFAILDKIIAHFTR